jgi:hypothetical protein
MFWRWEKYKLLGKISFSLSRKIIPPYSHVYPGLTLFFGEQAPEIFV